MFLRRGSFSLAIAIATLLSGCGGSDEASTPVATTPVVTPSAPQQQVQANQTVRPDFSGHSSDSGMLDLYSVPALNSGSGKKLFAVYLVGSDLETNMEAGSIDLLEMVEGYNSLSASEKAKVDVVVAFGGTQKEGWQGVRFASMEQIIADAGDGRFGNNASYLHTSSGANMGDASTLKHFVDYLQAGYGEHQQKLLVLWDHGAAFGSFGNDENFSGDGLTLQETESALAQAGMHFDVLGYDACLNGNFELAAMAKNHADYLISSEELEPGHGWSYKSVIPAWVNNSDLTLFGRAMIDNFVQPDVHPYASDGKTLAMVNLQKYAPLQTAVNDLGTLLSEGLTDDAVRSALIQAANQSEQFGKQTREEAATTIDLYGFAATLKRELATGNVAEAADAVLAAVKDYVVYSRQDGTRPNAYGVSIVPPQGYDTFYEAFPEEVSAPSSGWYRLTRSLQGVMTADTQPPEIVAEEDAVVVDADVFSSDDTDAVVEAFYSELLYEIALLLESDWAAYSEADQELLASEYWYEMEDLFWNSHNSVQARTACDNTTAATCMGTQAGGYAAVWESTTGKSSKQSQKMAKASTRSTLLQSFGAMGGYAVTAAAPKGGHTLQAIEPVAVTTTAEVTPTAEVTTTAMPVTTAASDSLSGSRAQFSDANLLSVRTAYGNIIEDEEGRYLATTALLQAKPTNTPNEYFTPRWNQQWYMMYFGAGEEDSLWLPLAFEREYRHNGVWFTEYSAEVDYRFAKRDYSDYPADAQYDFAKLYLTVDANNQVISSNVRPYKIVYASDTDMEGSILYDKASEPLQAGDTITTVASYYNLDNQQIEWFYESEPTTLKQAPIFKLELLEFVDMNDQPLDYYYMMIGSDVSGNWVATQPVAATHGG
ncbi:MAG: hypothetical protein HQL49_01535 [Gammaproteobacteria bacterium]|nr:hypothetical protein [Gammaproteobacteria bacterium]